MRDALLLEKKVYRRTPGCRILKVSRKQGSLRREFPGKGCQPTRSNTNIRVLLAAPRSQGHPIQRNILHKVEVPPPQHYWVLGGLKGSNNRCIHYVLRNHGTL